MLRSLKEITGYDLLAEDGLIGQCKDFLIDDKHWTIRYMVADTGNWLRHHKVLISPIVLGEANWVDQTFVVNLSKEQIETAPPLSEHEPVSRQYEQRWHDHHAHPYYWLNPEEGKETDEQKDYGNPNLRSAIEVIGYHTEALDAEIGHIDDFIIDDERWWVRYIVIDIHKWLMDKKFLIAPAWIKKIDHELGLTRLDLYKEDLLNCIPYDPSSPINKKDEELLFDYYGRAHRRKKRDTE